MGDAVLDGARIELAHEAQPSHRCDTGRPFRSGRSFACRLLPSTQSPALRCADSSRAWPARSSTPRCPCREAGPRPCPAWPSSVAAWPAWPAPGCSTACATSACSRHAPRWAATCARCRSRSAARPVPSTSAPSTSTPGPIPPTCSCSSNWACGRWPRAKRVASPRRSRWTRPTRACRASSRRCCRTAPGRCSPTGTARPCRRSRPPSTPRAGASRPAPPGSCRWPSGSPPCRSRRQRAAP